MVKRSDPSSILENLGPPLILIFLVKKYQILILILNNKNIVTLFDTAKLYLILVSDTLVSDTLKV